MREPRIKDYQAKFEQHIRLTAKRNTCRRYSCAMENFFTIFPRKKRVQQFRADDIGLFEKCRKLQGVTPTTLKFELAVLRAFWNFLIDCGAVDHNPVVEFLESAKLLAELSERSFAWS